MMGIGKPTHREYSEITMVLRRERQKWNELKNVSKWRNPAHGLPNTPARIV